jgi:hypothetical protein
MKFVVGVIATFMSHKANFCATISVKDGAVKSFFDVAAGFRG